jgi:large subunit ribosomal protein L17
MRHRVKKNHFNRDTNARKALLRNLVRSLVEKGSIVTTKGKAKEVKRLTDKLVSRAKKSSVASRRQLHQFFGKRDVVNTLVEQVAPAMDKRDSGFTRIKPQGKRRGDNSEMVKVEFVEKIEAPAKKVAKKAPAKKAVKPAAKKAASKKSTAKKTTDTKAKTQKKK